MAKNSQTIEIRILGQKTVLRATDGDPARLREITELVNSLVKSAEKRIPKGTAAPHQVLLLALMDLAEEYIDSREQVVAFKSEVDQRAGRILELIEASPR